MFTPRKYWIRAIAAGAIGLMLAAPASADGLYVGAGAYKTDAQLGSLDDSDTTSAVFVGYSFFDTVITLAGELGRYDLGSYSDGGVEVDGDATSLAAVVYLPLGPTFELYAKTGIASVDVDVDGSSDDDSESFSGVGFGLDILDTIDFYFEYLEFDTDVDFEMIGVGIRLDF